MLRFIVFTELMISCLYITKKDTFIQQDSVCFAKLFNKGLPVLCQLLSSKHVSDVLEAVQFFVTGL